MILTGSEIHCQLQAGALHIDPFDAQYLNPNSYNFHLGSTVVVYQERILDTGKENLTSSFEMTEEGYILQPERLYLGHIEESMGSELFVPIIKGRSSIGRLGLFISITADLIDLGAYGQWTLQMHAIQPVRIYPGMGIGQITWWVPQGEKQLYHGKYQNVKGPQASQSWRDFS
jgi:dCTP deaminase